jgi:uncharacterized protein (TIGR00661 family)
LQTSKRILIAPLDWGLGHTSRCIPIILELQLQNAIVIVACNEQQKKYLQKEVDNVEYILRKGYNIKYAKTKLGLILRIIAQVPKLISSIIGEHAWLQIIIQTRKINGVISDNRYGLFTKKVPCIFITHQLCIKVPFGKSIVHQMNQYFIRQYTRCWVPDFDGEKSRSGALSIADGYKNVKKIGMLSRFDFEKSRGTIINKNTILCILSGPEPQRSLLLEAIQKQIANTINTCTIVGDTFADNRDLNPQIKYLAIADTNTLQTLIETHQYIITRSGYSTMMDLFALGRNAIIIPTPGQTEQEYLGEYLMQKKWHLSVSQKYFEMQKSIHAFDKMHFEKYDKSEMKNDVLHKTIEDFLEIC